MMHLYCAKFCYRKKRKLYFCVFFVFFLALSCCAHAKTSMKIGEIDKELTDIRQNITFSMERIAALLKEVNALKKDQKTLTQALVQAATQEREASEKIEKKEENLKSLLKQKQEAYDKLKVHRLEFYQVLGILERIGIMPLPTILIHPDDALAAIRSAFLLGSTVPHMRIQLEELTKIFKNLSDIAQKIQEETQKLKKQIQEQALEREKLTLLLSEKAKLQKSSEKEILEQQKKSEELAKKAKSFEELIKELKNAEEQSPKDSETEKNIALFHLKSHFTDLKHSLNRPISGKIIRYYNSDSANFSQGEIIETSPRAVVTSPSDAIIAYAGAFRSYGKIIILDVGNDYYILLAGLADVAVEQRQIVLAGEPIGFMGEKANSYRAIFDLENQSKTLKNAKIQETKPILYIEFRNQGKPIDPSPWWVKTLSKRK